MTDEAARRGIFITFEGPDGAGKSSQALRLVASLRRRGLPVVDVREPGGTPIGERIRQLLLDARASPGHEPLTDTLLFVAARAQLVADVIRPALAEGRIVVGDRYVDSTLAYQGYGSGIDLDWLHALNDRATGGLMPDLTILLDLESGVGLARRESGPRNERTRFERSAQHDAAFHGRVREGYLELARSGRDRWRVVDAAADPEVVAAAIRSHVEPLLANRGASADEPMGSAVRING